MEQVQALFDNNWIQQCPEGGWCSAIVLAPKPHQEEIDDINNFIWRLCVSYRALNSVTKPFEFPIPRCDDALDNFCEGAGRMYWISLDAKSGFHQIRVRTQDQEKLAFYLPDHSKNTFVVMPFGPINAPACYTALVHIMHEEWTALFRAKYTDLTKFVIDIKARMVQQGDKTIMDDLILFGNNRGALLCLFDCVAIIHVKLQLSFNPKKCDFFLDRIEWIGHDLHPNGNSPAQSKFDLIGNWPLPVQGESLLSFIGLCVYYNRFIPWFESRFEQLRRLERRFHRQQIPMGQWTDTLQLLFNDLKKAITSNPVLLRYDASKPTFLKTDWSATAMGFVLMQPDDDAASVNATNNILSGGNNSFDTDLLGARLKPIRFGSRRCRDAEIHYHSFTGEIAARRWAIAANR